MVTKKYYAIANCWDTLGVWTFNTRKERTEWVGNDSQKRAVTVVQLKKMMKTDPEHVAYEDSCYYFKF